MMGFARGQREPRAPAHAAECADNHCSTAPSDAPELRTNTIPARPSPRRTSNSTPPPTNKLAVSATELMLASEAVLKLKEQADSASFPAAAGGYESPDYDSAANKVDIFVETGVGSVEIR